MSLKAQRGNGVGTRRISKLVEKEKERKMAREYHIIDADAHTYIPKDHYEKWLPKKFLDRAPKLAKDHKGGDAWQFAPDLPPKQLGVTVMVGVPYEQFKQFGHRLPDNLRRLEQWSRLMGDAPDAAVAVVAPRQTFGKSDILKNV